MKRFNLPRSRLCFSTFMVAFLHFFDGGAVNYTHLCSHFNVDSGKLKNIFHLDSFTGALCKRKEQMCAGKNSGVFTYLQRFGRIRHTWNMNNKYEITTMTYYSCVEREALTSSRVNAAGLLMDRCVNLNNVAHGAGQMPAYEKCNKNHEPVNEDLK